MSDPILLIEDDAKIARVVKVYLENAGYRVTHARLGKDGLDSAQREKPVAVLLDLMLPDTSGEEVCQHLKEIGDFPLIMLTAKSSEEERIAGFALGADDYVVKPFSPRELVWRVKAILKRAQKGDLADSEPVSFNGGLLVLDGPRYEVRREGRMVSLTPTEFKVLHAMASRPGWVFSRAHLVEKALDSHFEGYERSIDAHVKNVRQKIGDDPRSPTFVMTIYGVGYKFIGSRDV